MRKIGFTALVTLLVLTVASAVCYADANNDLFAAIKAKDINRVRALLDAGANVNVLTEDVFGVKNISPLSYAVNEGDTEIARLLIERGADVNFKDPIGNEPLLVDAAQRGETEIVRWMLEKGADVNVSDPTILGHTPLTIAAAWGRTGVVRLLLDHGASANQQNGDGVSALQCAASGTELEMVRLLIDRHADVNHRDKYGRTALFHATCRDCKPEIAQLLLARGADLNAQDNKGKTAFYYAQTNANQGVVAMLVKAGANGGKMPEAPATGLTAADIQFLSGECKIEQPDIDVISKLDAKTQQMLYARIAQRNCALLHSFIAVRGYFHQLKPKEHLGPPPAEWMDGQFYLTDEEFNQFVKIMDEAPI